VTIANIRAQLTGITTRADELLVLSVGLGDVLELSEAFVANTTTLAQAKLDARSRGQAYMDLANQLYQNGTFRRIILVAPPDISNSPYAQNAGAGVSSLIYQISDEFIYGIKSRASSYPRDGGIWFFDTTNLLRNINTGTGLNVNLTTPVCDEANVSGFASAPQLCSVRTLDADTTAARTANTNSLLETTTILPFANTSGTSAYSSNRYFYAGSVFPTPFIHQYIGSTLYNRMRSTIGF
jgi:phospholipase/lecithinase/hemolysin